MVTIILASNIVRNLRLKPRSHVTQVDIGFRARASTPFPA